MPKPECALCGKDVEVYEVNKAKVKYFDKGRLICEECFDNKGDE